MSASDSVTPRLYTESFPVSRAERHIAAPNFFPGAWQALEIAADFLACSAGMALAFWHLYGLRTVARFPAQLRQEAAVCLAVALLAVFLLHRDGAYNGVSSLLQIRETERALRASMQSALLLLPFAFFLGLPSTASVFLLALVLPPALLVASRHAGGAFVRNLCRDEREKNHAVLYGAGDAAARALSALSCRMNPVLVIDEDRPAAGESIAQMGYRREPIIPAGRGPVTAALLQSCQCSTLVVALHSLAPSSVDAAVEAAEQASASVAFLYGAEAQEHSSARASATARLRATDLDGLSLAPQFGPTESRCYAAAKRTLDFIGSSLLLVLLSPLFALIALLVKLESPGRAIFSQERVGRDGRRFRMFKFRSMDTKAAPFDLSPVTPSDPRITGIGRLLRATSLDELPQLANVILGQMSLVGPRPEMPFIVHDYTREQRQRLEVIPGITGLWQLSAARAFPIHENLHYDFYYIRNRTFFMDIAILVHTLFFALRGGI